MPSPSQLRRAERDRKAQQERGEREMEFAVANEQQQAEMIEELGDGDPLLGKAKLLAQHFGTPDNQRPRRKLARPASKQRH